MIPLADLAEAINPERCVLFLGAGASVTSGAPTGAELARQLSGRLARGENISSDLTETCSILENRYTRTLLVAAVRSILEPLVPAGGLLSLPEFDWHAIYTTNFDRLVEASYNKSSKQILPIRSNFDYGKLETQPGLPLFKIHGCLSQDVVDGYHGRMVLTERDYEEYAKFRETLFRRLELDLATKSVLVIGHSLKDPHIRQDMTDAATLHASRGGAGRLYAMIYEEDQDRAQLLERKGFTVSFGSLDQFFYELANRRLPLQPAVQIEGPDFQLPLVLRSTAVDAGHARHLQSNVTRLFNGSPASFADIAQNLTIRRSIEQRLIDILYNSEKHSVTVIGVAGVGKTTLIRRIGAGLHDLGLHVWEHRPEFPLRPSDWLRAEKSLATASLRGILIVDDCVDFMREVNALAEGIAKLEVSHLQLLLTSSSNKWLPRVKSPYLFSNGTIEHLSDLAEADIEQLTDLVDFVPSIHALVDAPFAQLGRAEKIRQLRNRCSADMFVCLKNIFATEGLDTILLREFASLSPEMQDVYRHVAALEAAGTRVHRQLILRILGIEADTIPVLLGLMEDLVEEYDINAADGLYGWATRHIVIAQIIARYKFADQSELFRLFKSVVDNLNPALWLELRTLRDLCDTDYGIGRLTDDQQQISLYESLIHLAPGERVPRHRIISKLLKAGQLDEASRAIKVAESDVGLDPPINRYKVRLAIQRAENIVGIQKEDRAALLLEAKTVALHGIKRFPGDKYAHMALGEVGLSYLHLTGEISIMTEAIEDLRSVVDKILDPHLGDFLRQLEREARV